MSGAVKLISSRLRFQGWIAAAATAVSFLVIIIAVAVSAGFRREIRRGAASVTGDVSLTTPGAGGAAGSSIGRNQSYISEILALDGVEGISGAVYRAGIVRSATGIHGVMFKGVECADSSLTVRIPARLARKTGLKAGDALLGYFVSDERVKARRFTVSGIYESVIDSDDALMALVPISDLQRLNGWEEDRVSALEVSFAPGLTGSRKGEELVREIGAIAYLSAGEGDEAAVATGARERYSTLFDWLDLIDFNVRAILVLMAIVAGFNMISGLLILLFRNISTIGILKALGMTGRGIAAVYLRVSARTVALGMAAGNALALLFCLIQDKTHLISLNPENYFVSHVPVCISVPRILAADAVSFAVIMLLMLIPLGFISKIDPSQTVRTR